jgi:hypothetical protein
MDSFSVALGGGLAHSKLRVTLNGSLREAIHRACFGR